MRINRRRLFLTWRHLSTEISVEIAEFEHIHDPTADFRRRKANSFMYIRLVIAISRQFWTIFKFIILDYLAANKSGILEWRRDYCEWSISSHSIWKVMPFRHPTEYNILRDNALHTHTQHWSIDCKRGEAAGLERYVQRDMLCPCVTQ